MYLDQSALSRLAQGQFVDLLAVLRRGCRSGLLICPKSVAHEYETVLAGGDLFRAVTNLSDELSLGVGLLDHEDTWRNEVRVAAALFLDEMAPMEVWQEAFEKDPQMPLDRLFPIGGLRVVVRPEKVASMEAEAQDQKAPMASRLNKGWQLPAGVTFAEQAETEFQGALLLYLMPLVDPSGFEAWLEESRVAMEPEWLAGELGSAHGRFEYRQAIGDFSGSLLDTYPGLRNRLQEFLASSQLRSMPSLRYRALLFAARACVPGRKGRDGDEYDIQHLTHGLSRCDVVTADGAWTQWCRARGLVPRGVRLFSSREFDRLTAYLQAAVP